MNWQQAREQVRGRLIAKYNAQEAKSYDDMVGSLSDADEEAYLADIQATIPLCAGQSVLDVGAGSGALSSILARVNGLAITAMEPSTDMLNLLRAKPKLRGLSIIQSSCDGHSDQAAVAAASFDAIASRQVVNSLFDPLTAFRNWFAWLHPGGRLYVIDGIYGRDGWSGVWQEEVDVTPLSAVQSLATIPYFLESVGFEIHHVNWMARTNQLASTRTKRYLVVATKPFA